jgi:hypothetical protein
MKKRRDRVLCLEIAVNIRIKQMLVVTDYIMPVERSTVQAGLVLCQGYVPEKTSCKQTHNFILKQRISWELGE